MSAKKQEKVYVLQIESESCDHYGPYVFRKKLSESKLIQFIKAEVPDAFDEPDGPGFAGSWVHVRWTTDVLR